MGLAYRGALALRVGDTVTVRAEEVDHHHRTPWFVKGKSGTIRLVHGAFPNPETRAHGGDGLPKRRLCQVEFRQADVWGMRYRGSGADVLVVDVFEQWLAPLSPSQNPPSSDGQRVQPDCEAQPRSRKLERT